jgi:ATP-binding cassette subfamily B protein
MALEKQVSRESSFKALRTFLPVLWSYKLHVFLAFGAVIVAAGTTLFIPFALQKLFMEGGIDAHPLDTSYFLLMLAAILSIASAIRYYALTTLSARLLADIRTRFFRRCVSLDQIFYQSHATGDLVGRLSNDTALIQTTLGVALFIALRNFLLLIGAVIMMVWTSPHISGVVFIGIPILIIPLILAGHYVRRYARYAQNRLAHVTSYASEILESIRTVQAFGMENASVEKFTVLSQQAYEALCKAARNQAYLTAIAFFMVMSALIALLWYVAQGASRHLMSSGDIFQFTLYAVFAAAAFSGLIQVWGTLNQAGATASRLTDIMYAYPSITSPPSGARQLLPQPSVSPIVFDAVTFAYPLRPDVPVLDKLSFEIKAGERVALVGPSGAGKSTIFHLLLRFYDVQKGGIFVEGAPINAVDLADLRRHFSLVSQDATLFSLSVADNIRYGDQQASDEQIATVAQQAAADGFIRDLPQGYETEITERGLALSGGQRQRIAIARALLKNAPILLLDEATSALDSENERLIQQALEVLMRERTVLIIAHHLTTVLSADRILVFDKGVLVEQGTHGELMAKNGTYARVARLQLIS